MATLISKVKFLPQINLRESLLVDSVPEWSASNRVVNLTYVKIETYKHLCSLFYIYIANVHLKSIYLSLGCNSTLRISLEVILSTRVITAEAEDEGSIFTLAKTMNFQEVT